MRTGNIKVSSEILEKIKKLPFFKNAHLDQKKYEDAGYKIESLHQHEQYGTGDAISHRLEWKWTDMFLPKEWKDTGLQFDRAFSGYCVPPHKDHYEYYKRKFLHSEKDIKRRLVFLEDWKMGHYFQVNETVFVKWRQGDWVEFGADDTHLGGNIGPEVRYTLQITGIEL